MGMDTKSFRTRLQTPNGDIRGSHLCIGVRAGKLLGRLLLETRSQPYQRCLPIQERGQQMITESTRLEILKEVRRIEEDALYSANGHFEQAKRWTNVHLLIGIPAALLSALAGASALAQFDNH